MTVMNRIVKDLNLGSRGINLWDAPENLQDGEVMQTANSFFRRGIDMKVGSLKHSVNEVVAGAPIMGLHRFYYDNISKALLAACGTVVSSMNDTTGVWTNIKTGLTAGAMTHFTTWGSLNKCYVANGTNPPFTINNALAAGTIASAPQDAIMFLPYRDRLLVIYMTDPSYLRWSPSYDDAAAWTTTAQAVRVPGPGANTALALHAIGDNANGVNAMVLVTKPTSSYLFSGTDLDPASGTFDARLDPLSDRVGTVSPKTIASTPIGTLFLGSDRQVYLLPFGTFKLEPVGHRIYSNASSVLGLESVPLAQLSKACGVYHKGFYKLTFPVSGSTNNRQYWLDVDRIYKDQNGHYGPWYGPMTGMTISCFVNQNGSGDDGRLLGGEHGNSGFVYRVNEPSVFTDNGADITMIFESRHEYFSEPALDTRIYQSEIEMTAPINSVIMSFSDIQGNIDTATVLAPDVNSGTSYGEAYYGTAFYSGSGGPVRRKLGHYDKFIIGRMISTAIEYTSGVDTLNLMAIRHEANPKRQTFQDRSGNAAVEPSFSVL